MTARPAWGDPGPEPLDVPTESAVTPGAALLLRRAPLIVYATICVAMLVFAEAGYPTADAVSYFSLAESWADGDWSRALNGFWSPLLPMLLSPFASIGIPLFFAGRLLMIGVGALSLFQLRRLMKVLGYDSVADDLLVVGASPLVAYAAVSLVTPDLLLAALLLGYLATMIDRREMSPVRRGVFAGLWAGAAFLAKAYALPFVMAHLVLSVLVRLIRRGDLSQRIRYVATAMATMSVVVFAWALPLSLEAGRPVITTSATYHVEITGPGARGNAFVWAGPTAPRSDAAVSGWEDPTTLADGGARSDGLGELIENRTRRLIGSLRVVSTAGGLMGMTGLFGTVSMLWWLISRRPGRDAARSAPDPFVDIVLAGVVFIGGLSVLVIETRYLWMPLLLTVPCAAWGIRRARLTNIDASPRLVAALIAAASVAGPAIGISRVVDKAGSQQATLELLDGLVAPGDRIVSSRSALSLIPGLCFENGCAYWGAVNGLGEQELTDFLTESDIDLVFEFQGDRIGLDDESVALTSPERRLVVYDLTSERS